MNLLYVKSEIPGVHKMVKHTLETLRQLMINRSFFLFTFNIILHTGVIPGDETLAKK